MKRLKLILSLSFISFFATNSHAQTKVISSIKKQIQEAMTDDERQLAIFSLCDLSYTLHPDTLMLYAKEAEKEARITKNTHDIVRAMYFESSALTTKGLIDSSLAVADKCLGLLSAKINDLQLEGNLFNQKGRCYMRKNQYKEAIDMGYRVISDAEKCNDTILQIKGKTLIGWAFLEMGQPKDALIWHLKALQTTTDSLLLQKYGILFANLALNYNGLGKADSGFYYINKAIVYSRKNENLFALSNSLAIQAQLYVRSGQAKLAEAPLNEVIFIRKLIGDPFYIVSDMAQLGLYYAHYGQPEKGVAICYEGINIAREYKIDTKLFFLFSTLAENYKALGNSIKYAEILEKIIDLKDSVYQKNSVESLAAIQAKYDLQRKENTIIQQKLDLVTKNYWLYGAFVLAFFGSMLFFVLFNNYRKRQKMRTERLVQEEKHISLLSVKEAEENERKRIAADLHDNLGAYAAAIASNVDNISLKKMDETALLELRNNSQSIVSQLNDTIWVLKKRALLLTAISDRLKVFAIRIQPSYPDIKIEVKENIKNDQLLAPSQAFHLFKIIQEAVINALKHSHCREIYVIIESDRLWEVIIEDDGTGISPEIFDKGGGNGIYNIKNRAEDAGWRVEWLKNEPNGTKVIIAPTTN